MFESLTAAPPDPILGLTDSFKKDPAPNKINLGVGVYQDPSGSTPVLECVKEAERRLVAQEHSKGYLPINGSAGYGQHVTRLLFGDSIDQQRIATMHTPGGTGALRITGEFIARMFPSAKIWLSKPTWANHPNVFQAAGLQVESYSYFDSATNSLDFDAMLADLKRVPAGDVVLLHGCCPSEPLYWVPR